MDNKLNTILLNKMWVPLHRQPSFVSVVGRKRKAESGNQSVFLDEPVITKLHEKNIILGDLEIGHSCMQGYRAHMEDDYIIKSLSIEDHVLVAIMDGHAGKFAAQYVAKHLKQTLEKTSQWNEYVKTKVSHRKDKADLLSAAIVQAYCDLDEQLRTNLKDESGCTAVCCIITPSHVVCGNVGDSRCVVGSKGSAISMTDDHKAENPEEKKRIEAAGGFVLMNRVNGELAMSRALGDFRYKPPADKTTLTNKEFMVICYPDIAVHERNKKNDEVIVLACDGVWDVISNRDAITFVSEIVLATPKEPESSSSKEAAGSLIDAALGEGSTDNISAIVVKFLKTKK